MKSSIDPAELLRKAGFRATPGRISLLLTLAQESKPLTVEQIHKKLGHTRINEVTLYRALEALVTSGIIHRVDLRHGVVYYEFSEKHHHHIVCTHCGVIEDFSDNHCDMVLKEASAKSRLFSNITSHTMELFGICRTCAA